MSDDCDMIHINTCNILLIGMQYENSIMIYECMYIGIFEKYKLL